MCESVPTSGYTFAFDQSTKMIFSVHDILNENLLSDALRL